MSNTFQALSPWADADPIALKGINARAQDLNGKTVGLFSGYKLASRPILAEVEKRLKERYSGVGFSWFLSNEHIDVKESKNKVEIQKWLDGVDAVVCAVGD